MTKLTLVLVAPVVPDTEKYRSASFSRAGNMYISNVACALAGVGLPPREIISFLPVPAFPRSARFAVGSERTALGNIPLKLLPFINLPLVKQVCIALGVLLRLTLIRMQHHGPIVVYTYNVGLPHGPVVLLAARLLRMKAVASLNDILEPGHLVPDSLTRRISYWLERSLIPRFDGHIAVADKIMRDLAPNRSYVRLEGAVTDAVFAQTMPKQYRPDGTFTVVFAGGLDRANGTLEMLAAFSLLDSPRFRLRIAGEGPLAERVLEAAASDSRIEYLGQLEFSQVLELYNTADVLVNMRLTTTIQTRYFYPSKMMEFMASGTPVISTCAGHTEEEFGDFVYLLRDESPQGLAQMIEHVAALSPTDRMRIGQSARAYMRTHKTWAAAGCRLAEYIEDLVTT